MRVIVDSSLLVSLYIQDANTPQALELMRNHPDVWITPLNQAEMAHAVHQHVFRKAMSEFEARRAFRAFEDDCARGTWERISLPESVWIGSVDLARRFGSRLGMRALDSLHVACALAVGADRFWTFDERQVRLAEAVGLDTTYSSSAS